MYGGGQEFEDRFSSHAIGLLRTIEPPQNGKSETYFEFRRGPMDSIIRQPMRLSFAMPVTAVQVLHGSSVDEVYDFHAEVTVYRG